MLSASFAVFLAELGTKVLVVDVDRATHGLTLLYLREVNRHRESCDDAPAGGRSVGADAKTPMGVFDGATFEHGRDVVRLPSGVDLLPATFDFSRDVQDDLKRDIGAVLGEIVAMARSVGYDYVFLDAQAGADANSRAAMNKRLCDAVAIVTEYDPLSAAGVERLKATMRDELDYMSAWVLVNKMLPEFANTYRDFLEFAHYLSPIPWDADVVRAYARRSIPLDVKYGNAFTLAVMQTLRRFLGDEMAERIDSWAEGRASQIRQPIEQQYTDAESELTRLLRERTSRGIWERMAPLATAVFVALPLASWYFLEPVVEVGVFRGMVVASLAGMATLAIVWLIRFRSNSSAEREVANARLSRQIGIVEERLTRLEVLRKGDLPALVAGRTHAEHGG